jgi:NhaA family Na+:H+ antiporter
MALVFLWLLISLLQLNFISLGNRVPTSLKVFLTALAVIDDLGAILVIAIFYTETIAFINLFIAFAIMGGLFILNRRNVHSLFPYLMEALPCGISC